jgi:hypothetical protein
MVFSLVALVDEWAETLFVGPQSNGARIVGVWPIDFGYFNDSFSPATP